MVETSVNAQEDSFLMSDKDDCNDEVVNFKENDGNPHHSQSSLC